MDPMTTTTHHPHLDLEMALDRLIGRRLRAIRTELGLSLPELATRTGFDPNELAEHETGTLPLPLSRAGVLAMCVGRTPAGLIAELLGFPGCPGCRRC
jgi:hypothetical protein